MTPSALLHGEYVGIKELRRSLPHRIHSSRPCIVTERGKPCQVMLSYEHAVELVETLEELRDAKLMKDIERSRNAYGKTGGVPLSRLAKRFKLNL